MVIVVEMAVDVGAAEGIWVEEGAAVGEAEEEEQREAILRLDRATGFASKRFFFEQIGG